MNENELEQKAEKIIDDIQMLDLLGIDTDFFSHLTDNLPVCLWIHDDQNLVVYGNDNFYKSYGHCLKKPCYQCIMGKTEPCGCCLSKKAFDTNESQRCKACKRNGSGYDLNTFHRVITNRNGKRFILKYSFHASEEMDVLPEKNMTDDHLEDSKELFLTMCSVCKGIKDKNRNWVTIDSSILTYFDVKISHGLCLECTEYLYPDLKLAELERLSAKENKRAMG